MHSDYSRSSILKQLQNEWLPAAEEIMLDDLDLSVNRSEQLFSQVLNQIENGRTSESLWKLSKKLKEQRSFEGQKLSQNWIQELKKVTEEAAEQVVLPQLEDRFQSLSEDSFAIKSGKAVKRFSRVIHKAAHAVAKPVRKLVRMKEKPAPVWHHSVPLKNILSIHLYRLHRWNLEWNNKIRKIEAEILLEAVAWTLHSTGLIQYEEVSQESSDDQPKQKPHVILPDEDELKVFIAKAIDLLAELRSEYSEKLKQDLTGLKAEIESAIARAGTIEQPATEYTRSDIIQAELRIEQLYGRDTKKWSAFFEVLTDRVFLSMDFTKLQKQAEERIEGFSNSLADFFSDHIESPAQNLMMELDKAIDLFEGSGENSIKEIREISSAHREKMIEYIDQKMMQPIQEFTEDAILSTRLDRFTSAIPEWTKEQPEKAMLISKLDLSGSLPIYEMEQVEWQKLIQRMISIYLTKEFKPKEVKPEQFLMELIQEMREISQIIYTNLEIADEVKRSDEEEPLEVAREGLERAKKKLEDFDSKVAKKRSNLQQKLSDNYEAAFSKLTMLLEKQDVNDIRMAGAEYMAKETAVDWNTQLQVVWARIAEKGELFGRFLWKKIKDSFEALRKFLGFSEKEKLEGDKTDLATFLADTDEQIAGLPFIYRRLFDFNKEVDERFFIRKTEQFERFKKGYELWQEGFPSTFTVVGEKGSGKSLFVNVWMKEGLAKHDVIEVKFDETIWTAEKVVQKISAALKLQDIATMEDLIAAIKRKKKPAIVILENLQNAYLRNISGMDAMEQILMLISETNKEIMWVVSSTRYAWNFLDRVMNITDYFTHAIETDKLSSKQIEELILKRHRASGYQLKFVPDEVVKKSRSFKKLMSNEDDLQEYLQERYFEKLAKLSEGNSSIAMIFWIRSIRDYDDTNFYINPFDFKAISRIDELDPSELFALAAIIMHDELTPEQLAAILNESARESRLMFSRLTSRSILNKTEHGYMLNHLIYRQVVLVLKEANFIH